MAHSLSPLLHRTAYDVLGLRSWTYDAFEIAAADLPDFLRGLDGSWAGLSLTMPLKAAVLPLLEIRSALVDAVGAANTVLPEVNASGQLVLRGENTDVAGMARACADAGVVAGQAASVLGAGATARSAVAALGGMGCPVTVYARSAVRRDELTGTAAAVGAQVQVKSWSEAAAGLGAAVVVNTTPRGAVDGLVVAIPERPQLYFDVVYDPWPTALAAAWQARSGRVIGGLELLVQQAVVQVALMTGLSFDPAVLADELRKAGTRALSG